MADYQLSQNGVIRESDGAVIPADTNNPLYQTYLTWLAAGNVPDPADVTVLDWNNWFFYVDGDLTQVWWTGGAPPGYFALTDSFYTTWLAADPTHLPAPIDDLVTLADTLIHDPRVEVAVLQYNLSIMYTMGGVLTDEQSFYFLKEDGLQITSSGANPALSTTWSLRAVTYEFADDPNLIYSTGLNELAGYALSAALPGSRSTVNVVSLLTVPAALTHAQTQLLYTTLTTYLDDLRNRLIAGSGSWPTRPVTVA